MSETCDIQVEKLTKSYGSFTAVDHISFEVPRGTILGFLGPNGAGKTTTIRMLTCYMPPSSGAAKVAGFDVFHQSLEVRKNIGYLPESTPLYTEMRVREYLDFRGRLRGLDRPTRQKRIDHVLEKCWLTDRQKSLISSLSKGYRQRVGIADALLHNPRVLVLDEPTVGLDPSQIREARKLISSLAGEHTVLFSTHILPEVEAICQRVVIIARGQIVAQGTPEELKAQCAKGRRLLVELRGPVEEARLALRALPGIKTIDTLQSGATHTLALNGQVSGELREQIAATISRKGWALREMRPEGATLEEFFVQITSDSAAA